MKTCKGKSFLQTGNSGRKGAGVERMGRQIFNVFLPVLAAAQRFVQKMKIISGILSRMDDLRTQTH
jgi:hypothetical protein